MLLLQLLDVILRMAFIVFKLMPRERSQLWFYTHRRFACHNVRLGEREIKHTASSLWLASSGFQWFVPSCCFFSWSFLWCSTWSFWSSRSDGGETVSFQTNGSRSKRPVAERTAVILVQCCADDTAVKAPRGGCGAEARREAAGDWS